MISTKVFPGMVMDPFLLTATGRYDIMDISKSVAAIFSWEPAPFPSFASVVSNKILERIGKVERVGRTFKIFSQPSNILLLWATNFIAPPFWLRLRLHPPSLTSGIPQGQHPQGDGAN